MSCRVLQEGWMKSKTSEDRQTVVCCSMLLCKITNKASAVSQLQQSYLYFSLAGVVIRTIFTNTHEDRDVVTSKRWFDIRCMHRYSEFIYIFSYSIFVPVHTHSHLPLLRMIQIMRIKTISFFLGCTSRRTNT